jgi:amidase
MIDTLGAFADPDLSLDGAGSGSLADLTFAVKDLFAIAGRVTGAGNPDWLRTHAAEVATAPAVETLLKAGASLRGITLTDELAFSLNGRNHHYGTPLNSAAPDRIPGGSSSGSASAVAGCAVDFALGTDTGGSVRVPASHCGIFGIRPTHGSIAASGLVPLAPSFDTIGWFARTPQLLAAVGDILLPPYKAPPFSGFVIADDCLAELDPVVADAFDGVLALLRMEFGALEHGRILPVSFADAFEATRVLCVDELKRGHGDWIRETKPNFGPGLAKRFAAALEQPDSLVPPALSIRKRVADHLASLLAGGKIAVFPTAPAPPPRRDAPDETLEAYRFRAQRLTCPAGLGGAPQINVPAMIVDNVPVGLALIGAPGSDRLLLATAIQITTVLSNRSGKTTVLRSQTGD